MPFQKHEQWELYSSLIPKRTPTALELYYHRVYKYEHPNGIKLNEGLYRKSRKETQKRAKRAAVAGPPAPPPVPSAAATGAFDLPAAVPSSGGAAGDGGGLRDAAAAALAQQHQHQQALRSAALAGIPLPAGFAHYGDPAAAAYAASVGFPGLAGLHAGGLPGVGLHPGGLVGLPPGFVGLQVGLQQAGLPLHHQQLPLVYQQPPIYRLQVDPASSSADLIRRFYLPGSGPTFY